MSRTRKRFPPLPVILAAILAAPVATAATAHADVTVRVRGKVNVRVGAPHRARRVRVHHHRHETNHAVVRLRFGGGVYIGGGFAHPPPPPPPPVHDCDCPPVHGYHTPLPAAPPPPPAYYAAPVVVARDAPAPLPRFGLGVFAGGIEVRDRTGGEDVGLLGRLRLTKRLWIEGEIAKSRMEGERVDRRLGGTLLYNLMPRSRFSLQLLGGLGVSQVELGSGAWRTEQEYGELGLGMSFQLTRRIQLAADVRAGARAAVDGQPAEKALQVIAPDAEDEEEYTRARLGAIVYF